MTLIKPSYTFWKSKAAAHYNRLDESTDTANIAYLKTFIRSVFTNFDIYKKLSLVLI